MTAQTFSARTVAALVSKRVGRKVSDKAVRAWSRDHIARLDDEGYTTHAYSAAERDRIVSAMVARTRPDAKGTNGRASSASKGRAKAPTTPHKAPTTPASAPKAPKAPKAPESAAS